MTRPSGKARVGPEHRNAIAHVVEGDPQFGLAVAQLAEKTSIFDRNHRLVGEGGSELDFLVREDRAETRYDAYRGAPNLTAIYKEEFCRLTGQAAPLLHVEWRANGIKAVRSLGIHSASDLYDFDHTSFWGHRLLLLNIISPERLARLIRNQRDGTKSRTSTPIDRRFGNALIRYYQTTQQLLDRFGSPVRRSKSQMIGGCQHLFTLLL
jgi:hypothetical protein